MSQTIVLTNGTFRTYPHLGHLDFFKKCRAIGDRVVVCVDKQERVQELKPGSFCLSDNDRLDILKSIKYIDGIHFFGSDQELSDLIVEEVSLFKEQWRIGSKILYLKGEDYRPSEILAKKTVESLGGIVATVAFLPGHSTTDTIKQMQGKI